MIVHTYIGSMLAGSLYPANGNSNNFSGTFVGGALSGSAFGGQNLTSFGRGQASHHAWDPMASLGGQSVSRSVCHRVWCRPECQYVGMYVMCEFESMSVIRECVSHVCVYTCVCVLK